MIENAIVDLSFEFGVRIVRLYKYMVTEQHEYTLSKQLLRCGTSIGANVYEAQKAQSKADFYSKMCIALKESNETVYWLKLLHRTEYLSTQQFDFMHKDATELVRVLTAICKTTAASK